MKTISISLIVFYQVIIATSLRALGFKTECRYSPTCSEYTKHAILRHGFLKGIVMGFRRILSCQSFF